MKKNGLKMPDLTGIKIDKAKEILEDNMIDYDDDIRGVFSFKKRGVVVKTEPKYGDTIKKNEKVVLYQSNGILLCLLPVFLLILLLSGISTFSDLGKNGITPPELMVEPIIEEGQTYRKTAIVKVTKDSVSKNKITHYNYCITTENNTKNCNWKDTYTKNVEVYDNGHQYVFVRGVDEKNNVSKPAKVDVYIDNNNPVIRKVKITELNSTYFRVKVDASDAETDIKYYYSLDGKNYVNDGDNHLFDNLNPNSVYTVYVKVIDEAGNEVVVKIKVKTLPQAVEGVEDISDDPENPENPENPDNPDSPNKDKDKLKEDNKWDIPKISLEGVPAIFKFGDKYDLPTWVDFGNDTGGYSCVIGDDEYTSTELIPIGEHTIICTATSSHDKEAVVTKDIKVEVPEGNDELQDGWLYYNLYYPEGSYNWQWRLDGVDGIRTGYDGTDWQDYVGPILVKVEDIQNIYIRYDIDGETYIIAPKGKTLVDIEPEKWTLYDGQTTKVKIVYDKDATVKEYRINGGNWMTYEGEFEVDPNTLIDARVKKNQDIYNNLGDYVSTKVLTNYDSAYISVYYDPVNGGPIGPGNPGGPTGPEGPGNPGTPTPPPTPGNPGNPGGIPLPPYPDYYLEGPVITASPTTQGIEYTTISITTADPGTIYYSEDGGAWKEYSGSFDVTKNETISAYYIRDEDGMVSRTTKYRVSFIKAKNVPYVGITASPSDYLYGNNDKVTVTITASGHDANTLEYSFNNIVFEKYTEPFEVDKSVTIYARASNSYGYGYDRLTITTKTPPVKKEKLNVSIVADPSKDKVDGLANKVTVTINYDSKATIKKYTIDGKTWNDYNGPFVLDRNATIIAYCSSSNGEGSAEYMVDYLTLGIARPIIKADTEDVSYQVQVSITYDENASEKLYRIDGGEWIDYVAPFIVTDNCIIEAYNENVLGYKATSMLSIGNIVPEPQYTVLEKDMYYLIKPNYPNTSVENTREYKWQVDGTWKTYNGIGIVLIKPEYNGKLDLSQGIKIIDDDGTEYIFTDHYYQLERPLYLEIDNLFIRWNNVRPQAPSIIFDTEEPSKEINVTISYGPTLIRKQYMLVSSDGTSTNWLDYTGPIKITDNNTIIYARGFTRTEYGSEVATKTVTNIDSVDPTISVTGDLTSPKRQVQLKVSGKDNLAIDQVRWIKGEYDESKFDDASFIPNNSVVTVNENDKYTFYAKDKAGNIVFEVVDVTNVDLNAPDVIINILTKETKAEVEVSIDFGDASTKQYSIGNQNNYKNYDGNFFVKSLEVYNLANQNGSITIYAKGIDTAGNTTIVSENIYNLDLNIFSEPVITSANKYGLITKKEIRLDNYVTVAYDNTRDDIINEVKVGNGNYATYTKEVYVDSATVYARSRNPETGLVREVSKYISIPSDALLNPAYDHNNETYDSIPANNRKRLDVEDDGTYKQILVRSSSQGEAKVYIYGLNGTKTSEVTLSSDTNITLDAGVTKIEIVAGSTELKVYEIEFLSLVRVVSGDSILGIVQDNSNLTEGQYIFKVKQETYPVHLIVKNGDQTITENTQYGDNKDIGTASAYAKNMVIVRVNGDYTVNSGVTVGPIYSAYGGPKGFILYVTGRLTNNGTIDNSHGAYSPGQDVYLWKNSKTSDYEYIPAVGGAGGPKVTSRNRGSNGKAGSTVSKRSLGGGGAGGFNNYKSGVASNGGSATSYSGGAGGGGNTEFGVPDGSSVGGAGGYGQGWYDWGQAVGGGAGNPSTCNYRCNLGQNGTGGMLVIYANYFTNKGTVSARGYNGGNGAGSGAGGAGSGGGSINIFFKEIDNVLDIGPTAALIYKNQLGTNYTYGGSGGSGGSSGGGNGGAGTVNIGAIVKNQYVDLLQFAEDKLNEANYNNRVGESIFKILEADDLRTGLFNFRVNNGTTTVDYPVHLIVLNGNQTITQNTQYGSLDDAASGTEEYQMAKRMVIVKVNGNYTIEQGVTVGPTFNTTYGGPKGFMLYVTGELINNGTIDNSHGAYAYGQNVYLWKNASTNDYEMIPAVGGAGATATTSGSRGRDGNAGNTAAKRALAGGGSGGFYNMKDGVASAGGAATSYSGGAGGGGNTEFGVPNGSSVGGAGGYGQGWYNDEHAVGGGAGNPSTCNYRCNLGQNGTGGLLIIYSNKYTNNGNITSRGKNGGNGAGYGGSGGAGSGAGSINIFFKEINVDKISGIDTDSAYNQYLGTTNVNGGSGGSGARYGGNGGNGTVNIGSIRNNQYYDLRDVISQDLGAFNNGTLGSRANSVLGKGVDFIKSYLPNILFDKANSKFDITYKEGYKNEYSLDFGNTWIEYTKSINVDKNCTVIARVVDEIGDVISSSSYTITRYGEEEEVEEPTTTTSTSTTTTSTTTTKETTTTETTTVAE